MQVFAQYRTNSEHLSVHFYPDRAGMQLSITHNWIDGEHRPLSRAWRTKVLAQLGFTVERWEKTEWGSRLISPP